MRVLVFLAFVAAVVFVVRWVYSKVQARCIDHKRRTGRWVVDEYSYGGFQTVYTVRNLHTPYEERGRSWKVPHDADDFPERLYAARDAAFEHATAQNTGRVLTS